mgnify:CR=1 FL=1
MASADFKALLDEARKQAKEDLEQRRAGIRKADIQRAKEEAERQATLRKQVALTRKRERQREALLVQVAEILDELARTLSRGSKHIHVDGPRACKVWLSVSYWSVREGAVVTVPGSKLSISVGVEGPDSGSLRVRFGKKSFRSSLATLADKLNDIVLPEMARLAAKAEVAIEVDLSDDYSRLAD